MNIKNKNIFGAFFLGFLMCAFAPLNTDAATSNTFRQDAKPYVDALDEYVDEEISSIIVSNTNVYNAIIKALKKDGYNVRNLKSNVSEMKGLYKDMKKEVKNLKKDVIRVSKRATDFNQVLSLIEDAEARIDVLVTEVDDVIDEINSEIDMINGEDVAAEYVSESFTEENPEDEIQGIIALTFDVTVANIDLMFADDASDFAYTLTGATEVDAVVTVRGELADGDDQFTIQDGFTERVTLTVRFVSTVDFIQLEVTEIDGYDVEGIATELN